MYGNGTALALSAYNKKYLGNANLKRATNAEQLIQSILALIIAETPDTRKAYLPMVVKDDPSLVSITCEKNPKNCTETEICERATLRNKKHPTVTDGKLKKWKVYGGQRFVSEATRRGLTCGVKPDRKKIMVPENYQAGIDAYNGGDFKKAMEQAKLLAPLGDADAQFYLGKMYAEGKGTLQRNTHAHMWFNLASANGHSEAAQERDLLAEKMTPVLVDKAQDLAGACMSSDYQDCALKTKPNLKNPLHRQTLKQNDIVADTVPSLGSIPFYSGNDKATIKASFRDQSLLRRKQIQYALRQLGYYTSFVDGLWGKGTERAVVNYGHDKKLRPSNPSEIFSDALSRVNVPSSFASSKSPKKTQRNSHGLTPIVNSPPVPADQAWAICKPKAGLVAVGVASQERGHIESGRGANCAIRDDMFGAKVRCERGSNFPGLIPLMLGIDSGSKAKKLIEKSYNAALDSCLAQYGWRD